MNVDSLRHLLRSIQEIKEPQGAVVVVGVVVVILELVVVPFAAVVVAAIFNTARASNKHWGAF
jgi:hypothetical protein